MNNTADHPPTPSSDRIDNERKFLEGLLKDRFNFFIVSAPVYLFGVFHADISHTQRLWALGFGAIVFSLFTFAIVRTSKLIGHALDLLLKDKQHPYFILCEEAEPHPRANSMLIGICFVVIGLTIVLFVTTLTTPVSHRSKGGNIGIHEMRPDQAL